MDQQFYGNVGAGVVANVLTTVGLWGITAGSLIVVHLSQRKQLLGFLGLLPTNPSTSIILSRLNIQPLGSIGVDGTASLYQGAAVVPREYEGAVLLRKMVASRAVPILPKSIRYWFESKAFGLAIQEPEIMESPEKWEPIGNNLFLLGSTFFNTANEFYTANNYLPYTWEFGPDHNSTLIVKTTTGKILDRINTVETSAELGMIARFRVKDSPDGKSGYMVFVCAGSCSASTKGCVKYLEANWMSMQREFGNQNFGIHLLFHGQKRDALEIVEPARRGSNIF